MILQHIIYILYQGLKTHAEKDWPLRYIEGTFIFIFIRQKRQHSMKSENEQQLRKKETKNNTQSLRHLARVQKTSAQNSQYLLLKNVNVNI